MMVMVSGLIIPAGASEPIRERQFGALEDYQAVVGGLIEAVDLPQIGISVYVNDEGLLQHLPFNSRASFLWWYHVPAARQKAMLVGDAAVVGMPDADGNTTEVPSEVRELLLHKRRYRIGVRLTGDPLWYPIRATHPDYWEAIIWAMVLLERRADAEDVRVVPVDDGAAPEGI